MSDAPTILLVDDEPDILEIFAIELEYAGYNIEPASNGTEAIEKFKAGGISAILSDIRMAGGDGIELLERVREISPANPPMLFMTGFADINQQEALDKGAAGFFHKPIDGSTLVEGLKHAMTPKAEAWKQKPAGAERASALQVSYKSIQDAIAEKSFSFGNGGLFIGIDGFEGKIGSLVDIDLSFACGSSIKGIGKVKWQRKSTEGGLKKGVGVEIEYLDDASLTFVCNLLQQNPTKAFIPAAA